MLIFQTTFGITSQEKSVFFETRICICSYLTKQTVFVPNRSKIVLVRGNPKTRFEELIFIKKYLSFAMCNLFSKPTARIDFDAF